MNAGVVVLTTPSPVVPFVSTIASVPAVGAVVSTKTSMPDVVDWLPARSVTSARIVYVPSLSEVGASV